MPPWRIVAPCSGPPANCSAPHNKLVELERREGFAALIVMVWHFTYAFMPERTGIVPDFDPAAGLVRDPAFALVNRPRAVALFSSCPASPAARILLLGWAMRSAEGNSQAMVSARRLTVAASIGSYALFRYCSYHYCEAAAFTGSNWLADSAAAMWPDACSRRHFGAIRESSAFTFICPDDLDNPVS
jgi:hypothetical protein